MAKLRGAHSTILRKTVGWFDAQGRPKGSDEDLYKFCKVHAPAATLRVRRLLYLRRLVLYAPHTLKSLVASTGPWREQCVSDLVWLWHVSDRLSQAPSPVDKPQFWMELIRSSSWKGIIKRIPLQTGRGNTKLGSVDAASDVEWKCQECGKVMPTHQAWASHRFRSHGIKSGLSRWCWSVHCLVCLKWYHSRERLMKHLKASTGCALLTIANVPPMNEEQEKECDEEERARRKRKKACEFNETNLPVWTCEGPVCDWACDKDKPDGECS